MTTGDGSPTGPPIRLGKDRPNQPPPDQPPRDRPFLAHLEKEEPDEPPAGPAWIVVPARAIALIVVLPFRLLWALLVQIGRGLRGIGRGVYRWVLTPAGHALAAVARGIGAVLDVLVARPLRWLYRVLLTPVGRFLARAFGAIATGIGMVLNVLLVVPAGYLWRYVLRPVLLGLAWLGHVLIAVPAQALWRYVLLPVLTGIAGTWRLAGRVLGWLWRTLIVLPVRVVIVEPARWFGGSVLRPVGRGVGTVWRVSVGDPLRAAGRAVRQASRDVRRQLRRTFGGR